MSSKSQEENWGEFVFSRNWKSTKNFTVTRFCEEQSAFWRLSEEGGRVRMGVQLGDVWGKGHEIGGWGWEFIQLIISKISAQGVKQIHKQNALFRLSEEGEGFRIGAQMGAVILENLLLLLGEGLKYHKKVRLSARGVRIGAQLGAVRSEENLLLLLLV